MLIVLRPKSSQLAFPKADVLKLLSNRTLADGCGWGDRLLRLRNLVQKNQIAHMKI